MEVLIIPDVHQTSEWKNVLRHYYNDFDAIIQVGDWFDTHDKNFNWDENDPVQNFLDAVEMSKLNPKFKICLGNHDFSYLLESHCSQFQWEHYKEIRDALMSKLDDVNIAYDCDGWVISHAGFTKTWMKNNGFETIEQVNQSFHNKEFDRFQFRGIDVYGDDPLNGPVWVRPLSLYIDSYFKYQVVGHTPVPSAPLILTHDNMGSIKDSIEGQKIILVDNDEHNCFYALNTEEK